MSDLWERQSRSNSSIALRAAPILRRSPKHFRVAKKTSLQRWTRVLISSLHVIPNTSSEVLPRPQPNAESAVPGSSSARQSLRRSSIFCYLFLMWNVLPLRFLILLVSTPFRLLAQRNEGETPQPQLAHGYKPPALPAPAHGRWLADSVPSVTESTTTHLENPIHTDLHAAPTTDEFK